VKVTKETNLLSQFSSFQRYELDELHTSMHVSIPRFSFQIVGIGLCGVFELIRETRESHPSLCLRTLKALLDMLQGQSPEGLYNEPPDVIGITNIM
jgi:E3 ubiquitin-protein ligase MYCBP2